MIAVGLVAAFIFSMLLQMFAGSHHHGFLSFAVFYVALVSGGVAYHMSGGVSVQFAVVVLVGGVVAAGFVWEAAKEHARRRRERVGG